MWDNPSERGFFHISSPCEPVGNPVVHSVTRALQPQHGCGTRRSVGRRSPIGRPAPVRIARTGRIRERTSVRRAAAGGVKVGNKGAPQARRSPRP